MLFSTPMPIGHVYTNYILKKNTDYVTLKYFKKNNVHLLL